MKEKFQNDLISNKQTRKTKYIIVNISNSKKNACVVLKAGISYSGKQHVNHFSNL